jgi:hypothetical protein
VGSYGFILRLLQSCKGSCLTEIAPDLVELVVIVCAFLIASTKQMNFIVENITVILTTKKAAFVTAYL